MQTTFSLLLFLVAIVHLPTWANATVAATGAIASHQVVAIDQKNLKGTMVLSNTDKDSLMKNKDELSQTLTQNLQADTKNTNSKVKVNDVRELSDGSLALNYECTGVSDQETAKKTLNRAVIQDDVKKTIVKSSKKDATTIKAEQKATNPQSLPTQTTQKTKETTQTTKPTTQASKASTSKPEATTNAPKSAKKSGKPLKPSKPSDIDCDKDHQVSAQDDKNINGVLVVKSCHASRFIRKPSRCSNVGNKLGSLLNSRLNKLGVKDLFNVKIVKTVGDKKQTQFHYTLACDKSRQKAVIDSLKDVCKDKNLADTVTKENQPDDDDSSSESSEESTTRVSPAKATQKDVSQTKTTAAQNHKQTTKFGATKKPPATKRTVQVKDCDDDNNIQAPDDQTLVGKIVVQNCACEKRFKNNETRLAAVSASVATQLQVYFQKLYNTKINYKTIVKVLTGNKTHTIFTYTVKVPKADHGKVKVAMKQACKDEEVKKTIEKESIKREGDDDSDSGSSEEDQFTKTTAKQTNAPASKSTNKVSEQTTKKPEPARKTTSKSGKTLKPSKPSAIDCDKDHKVTAQDDKNINGVLVVKSCHASRFIRKPSRCSNVGNKLGSLLNTRLNKLGIKDLFNVKIVKTVGDKKQTQFHYTLACDKSRQKTVIDSLKDVCKDKNLADTVTKENQPDDDDSSSESSEESTTRAAPTRVTGKDIGSTTHRTVDQSVPTAGTKPSNGTSVTKGLKSTGAITGTKGPQPTSATQGAEGPQSTSITQKTKGPKPTVATNGPKGPGPIGGTQGTKEPKPTGPTKGTRGPKLTDATHTTKITQLSSATQRTKEPKTTATTQEPKESKPTGASEATKGPKPTGATQDTKRPKPTGATQGTKGPKSTATTNGTKGPKPNNGSQGTKGPKPTVATNGTKEPKPTGATQVTKIPKSTRFTKVTKATSNGTKGPKPTGVIKPCKPESNRTKVPKPTKPSHSTRNCAKRTDRSDEISSSESDENSSSESDDFSCDSTEEQQHKPIRKPHGKKGQTGLVTRTLKTIASVPIKRGNSYGGDCRRCAFRKISSSLLLEGISLKQVSSRLCGRFPQNFKYVLTAEIRKYQRFGVKAIEITSISVDNKQNLLIEFDIFVNPRYNALIRNALRRAVISLDLNRVFKYQQ